MSNQIVKLSDLSNFMNDCIFPFIHQTVTSNSDVNDHNSIDFTVLRDDYYSLRGLSNDPEVIIKEAIDKLWFTWSQLDKEYIQSEVLRLLHYHLNNIDRQGITIDHRSHNVTPAGVIIPRSLNISDMESSTVEELCKHIPNDLIKENAKKEYFEKLLEIFKLVPNYRELIERKVSNPLDLESIDLLGPISKKKKQNVSIFDCRNLVTSMDSIKKYQNIETKNSESNVIFIVTIHISFPNSKESDQMIEILETQTLQDLRNMIVCGPKIPLSPLSSLSNQSIPVNYFYFDKSLFVETIKRPIDLSWDNSHLPQNLLDIQKWIKSTNFPSTEVSSSSSSQTTNNSKTKIKEENQPKPLPTILSTAVLNDSWEETLKLAAANAMKMTNWKRSKTTNQMTFTPKPSSSVTSSSLSISSKNKIQSKSNLKLKSSTDSNDRIDDKMRSFHLTGTGISNSLNTEINTKVNMNIREERKDSPLSKKRQDKTKETLFLDNINSEQSTFTNNNNNSKSTQFNGNIPELSLKSMHKVYIRDIPYHLGGEYLFCHDGCCEHIITITNIQQHHSAIDPILSSSYYPRNIYLNKNLRIKLCNICELYPSVYVTLEDRLTENSPTYFCV